LNRDVEIHVVDTLEGVTADDWNRLAGDNPFVRHEFLAALQDTRCAIARTGWRAQHLLLKRGGQLAGAMPLYLKSHSRGEYVFDHAWADAFQRHGIRYYPKALSAVPFSPVTGPRLIAPNHEDRVTLARGAIELTKRLDLSSLHVLFPQAEDVEALTDAGYMLREGVQFHWENLPGDGYESFALDFFYACYENTYREHWNPPYLSREFFAQVHAAAPESMLLVIAEAGGERLACALNMIGGDVMYGRYWGTREFISGLHFETCYMQGIEYCIEHGLARFEGGAQGVHKMSRGMLPTPTWSAHWIADRRFAHAIGEFLDAETAAMDQHIEELEAHTPFRKKT
jgi:predicted N-acyltransferase